MNDTTKKILLGVALILVAAGIAFGLYLFFRKSGGQTVAPGKKITTSTPNVLPGSETRTTSTGITSTSTVGTLPTAANIPQVTPGYYQAPTVKKISNDYAVYTSLNSGNLRYHNAADGKFYRLAVDGTLKEMTDQVFYDVKKVTWAKTKDEAVLEYPDGSKIVYNFETKKQYTLPKHWENFSFSPDSTQIAAKSIGLSSENRWLVTAKDDGTASTLIEPMGENADKVTVDWSPSHQVVAFSQTGQPLGAERNEVLLVGLNGENFKSIIIEGNGFDPQWSPTGKKLLYSVYSARSDYKPELWITDAYGNDIGANRQTIKINTWADKCTFQGDDTVYCAVPKDLPTGSGILPAVASGQTDYLVKVDLRTGLKTNIPLDAEYSISDLSLDTANNRLLFGAANKNGIFEVKL